MLHNLNVYYFTDKFDSKELNILDKKVDIIYRNYSKNQNLEQIQNLRNFCKIKKKKFFFSNNLKLAIKFDSDGIYIPSFNRTLNFKNLTLPKKFNIIGSAHNIIEIKIKQLQGCKTIFISPIFFNPKNRKYLGISKFNLLTLHTASKIIALGGLNQKNIKKLRLTRSIGLAGISLFKKKAPLNL